MRCSMAKKTSLKPPEMPKPKVPQAIRRRATKAEYGKPKGKVY